MKIDEMIQALRTTPSRSKRTLLDAAAAMIEQLLGRCARYAEEIAVLQEKTRWIPVEERLPEPGERVLATSGNFVGEAYRLQSSGAWARSYGIWHDCIAFPVTHWMPVPEGPEVAHD